MTETSDQTLESKASSTTQQDHTNPAKRSVWREVILNLGVIGLISAVGILLVFQFFPSLDKFQSSRTQIDRIIQEYYIGEIPEQEEFVDGQLKGYVSALNDPYSDYMTEEDNDEFNDSLNERYEGVGIRFEQTNQEIVVIETLPGGPAESAGISGGDILVAVDDQNLDNYDLDEVADLILGETGTEVELTIDRNGEIINFNITREKIFTPLVELQVEGNVGVISVISFGDGIDQEMLSVANQIVENEQIDRLVLDLRSNSGGVLDSAVDLASYFLEEDKIVAKEQTKDEMIEDRSVFKEIALQQYPLVVLVNSRTASASEIVAAALRDHRQVPLIGQKTYGKGVVQQIFKLNNGDFLRITVAEWLTPGGDKIDQVGLEPDIKIRSSDNVLDSVLENYDWDRQELKQVQS